MKIDKPSKVVLLAATWLVAYYIVVAIVLWFGWV
jgi:hypothetical protein